jgi:hypothetical protein
MDTVSATNTAPSPATLAAQAARRVARRKELQRLERELRHEALCQQLLEYPESDKSFKATIVRRSGGVVRVRVQRTEFDVPFAGTLASGQRLLSVRVKNATYDLEFFESPSLDVHAIDWLTLEWVPPAKKDRTAEALVPAPTNGTKN